MMQTPTDNAPYYVVVRFGDRESLNPGQLKIWRSHDPDHIWGSPAYEVLEYFSNRRDAQDFVRTTRYEEISLWTENPFEDGVTE
tara:strand:+ start:3373 stop:3624 length:252 start_codon:yes stop_codon:yes gene_type:complete